METWEKKQQERLLNQERIYNKGILSCILRYGILCWGVPSGILFAIVMCFSQRGDVRTAFGFILLQSLIMFPLGGAVLGAIMWITIGISLKKVKNKL